MIFKVSELRKKWLYAGVISFLVLYFNTIALGAATATLTWEPPATNTDGSPLIDLGGYVLHIGLAPDDYTQNMDVGDVTTYVLDDLDYDVTYYLAVTAYNTSGNESGYSNKLSIMTDSPPSPEAEITITDSC